VQRVGATQCASSLILPETAVTEAPRGSKPLATDAGKWRLALLKAVLRTAMAARMSACSSSIAARRAAMGRAYHFCQFPVVCMACREVRSSSASCSSKSTCLARPARMWYSLISSYLLRHIRLTISIGIQKRKSQSIHVVISCDQHTDVPQMVPREPRRCIVILLPNSPSVATAALTRFHRPIQCGDAVLVAVQQRPLPCRVPGRRTWPANAPQAAGIRQPSLGGPGVI
jgi:hypothetical protein